MPRSALLIFCCFAGLLASETRIYFIGNSLTDEVKYPWFEQWAEAAGHDLVWGRHMIPGAPIRWLYQSVGKGFQQKPFGHWDQALRAYEWDVITLQPFSAFEGEYEAARKFCHEIAAKSPEAEVFIYAQWPGAGRGPDWVRGFTGANEASKNSDPENDYAARVAELPSALQERYQDRSLRHQYEMYVHALRARGILSQPVRLIPVGHVMQLLGQKMRAGLMPGYQTPWDFYSDGIHVTNLGSYIVACTFYATIFGHSPVGLPVGPYQGQAGDRADYVTITEDLARIIQESVWEVVTSHPLSGVVSDEAVQIATPILSTGVAGEAYRCELLPAFGQAPYEWSLAAGALPPGLSLNPTGILHGICTEPGTWPLTLQLRDARGTTAERVLTLHCEADVAPTIPAQELPALALGDFRRIELQAHGGNGRVRWELADDTQLPPGLRLDGAGLLSGACGKEGTYTFTLVAIDGDPAQPEEARADFNLTVGPATSDIAIVRRVAQAPEIDGDLTTGDWDFRYTIDKPAIGASPAVRGRFDIVHDGSFIYLAVQIDDATPIRSAGDRFAGDAVVVFLDVLNNREDTYNADDLRMVYARGNRWGNPALSIGHRLSMSANCTDQTSGHDWEWKLNTKTLGLTDSPTKKGLVSGTVIGLDIMLYDAETRDDPVTAVVWKGSAANLDDPSGFGTVILE